jgi:16S rRNA G966 N2-methylase RsmD
VQANLEGVENAEVVRQDARTFARAASAARRQYDLVFLDPPYRDGPQLAAELSETLAAVLSADGVVVFESDRRSAVDLPDLHLFDERRYGDTLLRIYDRH